MSAEDKSPRAMAERRVGQTLNDKWRIDRVIDLGGMAAVFAATHRNGKRVAIKMLHPQIAANQSLRTRFLREGYVANRVEHRGAVQILDDDKTADGAVFIVMELLEGESLERLMARAPGNRLPAHEVLGVADQVLDTLAAFHAEGVIHRDIKPANLFITRDGVVKVLDFGLARLREPDVGGAPHTGVGIVLGTVSYMPPEQALGRSDQIDVRADIFAVGAVMFQAFSGSVFVKGETPLDRLRCAGRTPAPKLASQIKSIPDYIATVVDKALAFDKTERWADARSMRAAIQSAYRQLVSDARQRSTTSAPPLPQRAKPTRDPRREPSVALEVSGFDVVDSGSATPPEVKERGDQPPPTPTAGPASDPTGGETIYREALEPSLVVDVSFGEDVPISVAPLPGDRRART